jgi:hypothetical protein
MTTTYQEEQRERHETLEQDKRLREQQRGATYSSFADAFADEDRGGRFKAVNKTAVVGATPAPAYPAGPAWCADPTGVEPALGVDINEMQPTGEVFEVRQSLEAKQSEVAPILEHSPFSAQGNSGDPSRSPSNPLSPGLMPSSGSSPFTDDDEPPRAA